MRHASASAFPRTVERVLEEVILWKCRRRHHRGTITRLALSGSAIAVVRVRAHFSTVVCHPTSMAPARHDEAQRFVTLLPPARAPAPP
jgi:hypothetical protein